MIPHVFANGYLIKICKTLCTLSAKCHSPRIEKRKITQALAPTPKPTHSFPHQHLSLSVLYLSFCLWILPIPGGYCPFLGDTARAWGILPVPGGYCSCLGDFTSPYEGFYFIQKPGINGSR